MVRRTKEEALETRCRIIDTAEHVFSEKGVANTSLADIADAAGLTRGAIYWHFKNKGDLFTAMLDRVALPMEQLIRAAADDATADPFASLRACCLHLLRQTVQDVQCRRVFEILTRKCEYVDELHSLTERLLQCRTQGLDMMERALRNAVRKGQLPAYLDTRRAAVGLHAYVDGLIYDWLTDPASFALGQDASALVDQYLDGLRFAPERIQPRADASIAEAPPVS